MLDIAIAARDNYGMGNAKHFLAVGVGLAAYVAGSALNVLAASVHGGWIATGATPAALYWIGDRFAIIGAHSGYTRWASPGDFLVWAGELTIALTWAVWGAELVATYRRRRNGQ